MLLPKESFTIIVSDIDKKVFTLDLSFLQKIIDTDKIDKQFYCKNCGYKW